MLKKLEIVIIVMIFLLGIAQSNVRAVENDILLQIVSDNGREIYSTDGNVSVSKKIINNNSEQGMISIETTISNKSKDTVQTKYEAIEVFIVLEEEAATGESSYSQYLQYVPMIANAILNRNPNTKIGIVGVTGPKRGITVNDDGKATFTNDEGNVLGTADNAEIVCELTNDTNKISTSLSNMNKDKIKYYSNMQAGLRLASNSFSGDAKKIILTYNAMPSVIIGSHGSLDRQNGETQEEAAKRHYGTIVNGTKSEIQSLNNKNINLVVLTDGSKLPNAKFYNSSTGEKLLEVDINEYNKEIYGTTSNPTYGKVYTISIFNFNKIINENISGATEENIPTNLENVTFKEYFTDEIINNFEISTENSNIDLSKLAEEKYLEYSIGKIKSKDSVKVTYTLKAKKNISEEILMKQLNTNEKTVISYKNGDGSTGNFDYTESPTIEFIKNIKELTAEINYNPEAETEDEVVVTIKANKEIKPVDGWNLSEDKKTLTKKYTENTNEIVHLIDIDNIEKDVEINVNNIVKKNEEEPGKNQIKENTIVGNLEKDNTTAPNKIPQTGNSVMFTICIITIVMIAIVYYKRYNEYKEVK